MTICRRIVAVVLWIAVAYAVVTFPVYRLPMGVGLAGLGLLTVKRPLAWTAVLPAVLPAIDLTPWSGRFFVDEFDLCIATALASNLWASTPRRATERISPLAIILALVLAISYSASTTIALLHANPDDFAWIGSYRSPYNALRVAKPFFYILLLCWQLQRFNFDRSQCWNQFLVGTVTGIAFLIGIVAMERLRYTGIFNGETDFRPSGNFSTMQIGGAHIDAYLVWAVPMLASAWRRVRSLLSHLVMGILAIGLAYSVVATYSRAPIALATLECVVLSISFVPWHNSALRLVAKYLLIGVVPVGIGAAVWASPFLRERFDLSAQDWQFRVDQWRDALTLREKDPVSQAFGMGAGSFPNRFAAAHPSLAPADYRIVAEQGNQFLELTGGEAIYFGQYIRLRPREEYQLSFDCRRRSKDGEIAAAVCEKTIGYSYRCANPSFDQPTKNDEWTHVVARFGSEDVGGATGMRFGRYIRRPANLAFMQAIRHGIDDIDNVHLIDSDGRDLIANGDFDNGQDHWFFEADNHVPWHIFNLYLHLVFEQGWFGLTAFVLLSGYGLARVSAEAIRGDVDALAIACALLGLLLLGMIDSLLDAPRVALLYYMTLGLALFGRGPLQQRVENRNGRN